MFCEMNSFLYYNICKLQNIMVSMETKQEIFKEWLLDEIKRRDWSLRELARRTGYSPSHISNVVKGNKPVYFEFCHKVALALDKPPTELFVMANLIEPPGDFALDEETSAIVEIYKQSPRKTQKEIFEYVKWYSIRHQKD